MTTTALILESPAGGVDLAADLAAAGIRVLATASRETLVRDAAQHSPDVVVCHDASPDEGLFAACARLAESAPCPVLVFTQDPEAAKIERAVQAGIDAYVVNGYAPARLRSVIQLARARHQRDSALGKALAEVTRRFDERKLVDRAKGILMRARQVDEDEAFAVLRAASMHSNRRVGQVSKQVIAAAHYADAVNRSGKLRMLSQRIVKAAALMVFDPRHAAHGQARAECAAQIDAHIAALAKSLSKPTFGDLLESVDAAWRALRDLSDGPPTTAALGELDLAAEALLLQAERLTRQLETAGLVTTLRVINVAGRQRMLSQRHAKQALLGLLPGAAPATDEAATRFTGALAELNAMPLSSGEIRALLAEAEQAWAEAARLAGRIAPGAAARALDATSERVLALFETLTGCYERSMQVLMG